MAGFVRQRERQLVPVSVVRLDDVYGAGCRVVETPSVGRDSVAHDVLGVGYVDVRNGRNTGLARSRSGQPTEYHITYCWLTGTVHHRTEVELNTVQAGHHFGQVVLERQRILWAHLDVGRVLASSKRRSAGVSHRLRSIQGADHAVERRIQAGRFGAACGDGVDDRCCWHLLVGVERGQCLLAALRPASADHISGSVEYRPLVAHPLLCGGVTAKTLAAA